MSAAVVHSRAPRSTVAGYATDERDVAAPGHLPQAGDAGGDVEALLRPAAALPRLLDPERARPDQAHVAGHDVEDLRQLVEAPAPQPGADARDPRVLAILNIGPEYSFRRELARAASAPSVIERNLKMRKVLPPRPMRSWR